MNKPLIFYLTTVLLLSSCQGYNDSFHNEFYDNTNASYQTFEGDDSAVPGDCFKDTSYKWILDYYFDDNNPKEKVKTLTYKKRSGYVAIYFKTFKEDNKNERAYNLSYNLEVLSSKRRNKSVYYLVAAFNQIAKEDPKIKDGYSRLVFKDFATLNDDVYKNKYPLVGIFSYLDVYEGDNKLFTTYLHYDLEEMTTLDFFNITLNTGYMPEKWADKTYSTFPHEGTFLNYVGDDVDYMNVFSNKYLNTFIRTNKVKNTSTLASFRFEIIENNYILIPEYCLDESPLLWGEYLDVISNTSEKVTRLHHTGEISYFKVDLDDLRAVYNS